ncbi:MAG: amidohydrolase family protein [Bacteroidales bacterium]|nr:amidohydrolase family protein [Bacteroidales bacterium]
MLLVITSQGFSQETGKTNDRLKINDVHCHYVDFIQKTDGIDTLLKRMDSADVENIVLFGLSVTKLWTDFDREQPKYYDDNDAPVYYYGFTDVIVAEAVKKLSQDQQDRIYPMICGFNPVDKNGLDHIKRMVKMYPDFWVGIGEVFFRHDDLTRMTYGRNPTANCVSMDSVYEYAAEKNLPIWIHSDIADPMSKKLSFLYEMEEALKKHPHTKMVWCHIGDTRKMETAGLSDTGEVYRSGLADTTRRLLNTYPCLYYDISWVVYEQIIAPDSIPSKKWIKVFKDFPDRFMVGSDKIGDFSEYEETIRKYDVLFNVLPKDIAQKLAYDNLFELIKKKPKKDK